jgi:phosphopantothenoylcysteine decarboxylase/phosphopantothenate--cysteine ligase
VASTIMTNPSVATRAASQDLAGLRVVVSAGGTHEHLDPVRFLGNSSSGLMGWALARAAALRGAEVRLVAANVVLEAPAGIDVEPVTSTAELAEAMTRSAKDADVVVMAAAPADFTPADTSGTKIKKDGHRGLAVALVQTTDVLAGLVAARTDPAQVIIGFAAETPTPHQSLLDLGRAKLARKGCDLLVLNEVGRGLVFGQPDSTITILGVEDEVVGPIGGSKDVLAHHIWDSSLVVRGRR